MKLGVQFYTLREFTKTREDFRNSLRKVSEIGYRAVQLSAIGCMNGDSPEVSAADARALLDEFGLECAATHRPWAALRDDTEAEIEFHRTLGCTYTAIGGVSLAEAKVLPMYQAFLDEAKPVVERLAAAGIRFGYHNHDHEFARDESTGKPGYENLIAANWLQLEVDVYWVAHAGAVPADVLGRLNGRIDAVHAKDREVILGEGPVMAPVGEGLLDWDAILLACRGGGTEWLIVEQDVCRRDPFDCLRSSFEFLSSKI